jgi:drug/metabolite transporter (DMT)-like permease
MIAHPGIILAVAATVVYNVGFILEKRALDRLPPIDAHHVRRLVRTLFTAPEWLVGFAAICAGLGLQILVLSLEPLTVAQPLQASGVVVTIIFSRLLLHERLGRTELGCVAGIAVAVLLLSLSSGHGAGGQPGTHAAGAAIAAAAVPVFLVVPIIYCWANRAAAGRHRYQESGASYGICAGLVYGVAGLALKALSAAVIPHSRDGLLIAAVESPYLYMMLAVSAAGMCLFQTALQRSRASIVMPISLVISTGYLVAVGSVLFHERLPDGPVPLVMRLAGGIIAVTVPVVLAVMNGRGAARPRPAGSGQQISSAVHPAPARHVKGNTGESGPTAAEPSGLPDRQAGAALPRRR